MQDATENEREDCAALVGEGDDEGANASDNAEEAKDGGENAEAKPKIDPKDWPMRDIKEPGDNDVLFGRGGQYASYLVHIF